MAFSSPGIGSGLDVNGLLSQLMSLERRPLALLDHKEASYKAKLSAYGTVKGAMSSFQSAMSALANPAKFSAAKASVADTAVASASASASAAAGSFGISVGTLAQAHKLKSGHLGATTDTLGSGTLTIQFGTYSGGEFALNPDKPAQTITIGSGQSTLAGVRDAINAANAGVTASIVNDGSGNRLVIASNSTGLSNALKITVTDDDLANTDNAGLSSLAYDASAGGTTNLAETVAARDATLTIDGIAITKASNTISDAIEGVTLNLLKADSSTTLTVARDTSGAKSAVEAFIKAYNDLYGAVTSLTRYDNATNTASVLTGDATLRSIISDMRSILTNSLDSAGGGLQRLADIGVAFQKDGTLKLETPSKLEGALADSGKDVATLFAALGKPTDSLVSFVSASGDTKSGSYAVNITQLASRGKAVSAVALGGTTTISAGLNDTLAVSINGVAATLTLAAGDYTPAQMAAEIQSRINGASALSAAGISVTVTQSASVLTITSDRFGSSSTVAVTGGTAQAALFGATTDTDGVDVAGSIGGMAAIGSGQTLTGAGDAGGLKVSIAGGDTGGRGVVNFARGYAEQFDSLIDRLLDDDGPMDSRLDGINASIKDIGKRRDALEMRMELIERRYRAQFSALDTMISSMTQTSNFLAQQLASLPGSQ